MMVDLSVVGDKVGGDAKGVISELATPQSESQIAIADLPQTPTKGVTRQLAGSDDTVGLSMENAKPADAELGSKLVTGLSPVSTPGSASRANFRTEKLKDSPPERRGFDKPPLSFGSVVSNVPAPVFTGVINRSYKKLGLLEQPPLTHTPSLEGSVSYIGSFRTEESTSQYERSGTDQIATFPTMDDIMGVNPYLRRADEIGFRHQVPGVGHLGNCLVPPGWKEGDSPITPGEAKKLFDSDRQEAVHDLELSLANQKHLNDEEKEKFSAGIDDLWKARLLLDHTVLTERLLIHKQHHERQQKKMERSRREEPGLQQYRLSEVPQPMQSRAMASYMPAPPPESPSWRRISNCPNQMDSRFGDPRTPQNFGSWQSHMGPEKSPIALDRSHMSSRMGSAYITYQPNNVEIARQALEYQQYFNTYGSAHKPYRAQEQLSQQTLPSSIDARPTISFEGNNVWTPHHGYLPEQGPISQYRNDPFTYTSYPHVGSFGVEYPRLRSASFEENPLPRPVPYQTIHSGYGGSTNTNMYHSGYDPSLHGRPYEENPQYKTSQTALSPSRDQSVCGENPLRNSQYEIAKTGFPPISDPHVLELTGLSRQEPSNRIQYGQKVDPMTSHRESHLAQLSNIKATGVKPTLDRELPTRKEEPPELNERVAETNVDKTGQWYDNEAELAKLPTSIPSKEFVRAALEEAERGRGGAKATPRKRRPKPEVDATRGFSISDAAAKLLALKGVPDRRKNTKAASTGAMPGGNATFPSVAPAPGGLSSAYNPSPPQKANYLYSRGHKEEAVPGSENGSDHFEDPNDGDYGKRTTRRKTTIPRKNSASRSNPGSKKKRKSAIPLAPLKRSRLSVDGPASNSEDDAEGSSDDPAMVNLKHDEFKKRRDFTI